MFGMPKIHAFSKEVPIESGEGLRVAQDRQICLIFERSALGRIVPVGRRWLPLRPGRSRSNGRRKDNTGVVGQLYCSGRKDINKEPSR